VAEFEWIRGTRFVHSSALAEALAGRWGLLVPRPLGFNPLRKVGLTPIGEFHYAKRLLTSGSLFMDTFVRGNGAVLPTLRATESKIIPPVTFAT